MRYESSCSPSSKHDHYVIDSTTTDNLPTLAENFTQPSGVGQIQPAERHLAKGSGLNQGRKRHHRALTHLKGVFATAFPSEFSPEAVPLFLSVLSLLPATIERPRAMLHVAERKGVKCGEHERQQALDRCGGWASLRAPRC